MISRITPYRLGYQGGYSPLYRNAIYSGNAPYRYRDSNGGTANLYLNMGIVLKATLTQELNKGGYLNLSLRKSKANLEINTIVDNFDTYMEVRTPYNMEGRESDVANNPERLSMWRGTRGMTVEFPDHYELTYEGDLSYQI